jgi:hypothetical protein
MLILERRLWALVAASVLVVGCSGPSRTSTPTGPSNTRTTGVAAATASASASATSSGAATNAGAAVPTTTHPVTSAAAPGPFGAGEPSTLTESVSFPPRNEPFDFRQQLDRKYRDGLKRGPTASYVDAEGTIVWTQEYLRYRVNGCTHTDAMQRVLFQVDGGGVLPSCGEAAAGQVRFPPRDEPFDFRLALERKYRDGLRRTPTDSYVDVEGDIVWTQEYLRYRVNGCGHSEAVDRVFTQIDGGGTPPVCAVPRAPAFQYSVLPVERRVSSQGAYYSAFADVTPSDAQWRVTSDQPSWLSADTYVHYGSGVTYYYVAANSSSVDRVGHITIGGLSGLYPPAVHTVTQAGR